MDVLVAVIVVAAAIVLLLCFGPDSYDRAMKKDIEYFRTHPGCTWEEAHRNRERFYHRRGL